MSPGKKPRIKKPPPPPTPKTPKPWDVPPQPKIGDSDREITYAAVGRALSQWELFESNLLQLFVVFVGSGPTALLTAARAYGTIQTFRGRADMIEGAAEVFFLIYKNSDLEKRISDFMDIARNYAARRNEIAHGIVWTTHWAGTQKQGSALFPARYASNKNKIGSFPLGETGAQVPTHVYSSAEIGMFTSRFLELTSQAHKIYIQTARFHYASANKEKLPT